MTLEYQDRYYPSTYTFEVRWDADQMRDHDKEYNTFDGARSVASRNRPPKDNDQGDLGRSYIVVLDETHCPVQEIWN